ncbi:bile acid:sodium symporter [Hymenobacter sp. NBH84]|uniref:bile acid:sodium symporter family protein n=1 Tax=Hymenobacter sp. NBH84 TaxID=2596915 RepID=UPI00162820D6|nr:bile acid:sodium symporter family protein [Hymenobacter sp. NBH84]QNE39761.1 bile acid:sodium symporter [Hymenobacter sp. NBH84]
MSQPAPTPTPPTGFSALLARIASEWFLLGLAGVVLLAYLFPNAGSDASPLPWHTIKTVGVSIIFFAYGLRLSPAKLKTGMRNWQLHLVTQLTTFALFPLLALAVRPFFTGAEGALLWQSIFFLCALPSTVSTSVVMVSIAQGNIPAAIFNATLSGLLGIALTPLLTGLVLQTSATGIPLQELILDLVGQVIVPVAAGVLLNRWLGAFAERNGKLLRISDQVIILLIVFTAFCESFAEGVFSSYALQDVVGLSLGMVGLYFAVFGIVWGVSGLLGFPREDRITAVFCGSKKSLVHGSVFASLLFPGAAAGALLLPLMLYHALQIIVASTMAQRMGKRAVISVV